MKLNVPLALAWDGAQAEWTLPPLRRGTTLMMLAATKIATSKPERPPRTALIPRRSIEFRPCNASRSRKCSPGSHVRNLKTAGDGPF
jgi:hypothetical protein